MSKFDIVIAGDCNIDLIFNEFHKLPDFGTEVLANQFEITLGSSAGIVAAHMASLGAKVAYVAAIGNDNFGQIFKSTIESHGVCTDYMIEKDDLKTGVTVVMAQKEERANITHSGAMASLTHDDLPWELIKTTPFFHLSNPYVLPNYRDSLPKLYKRIKSYGVRTSLDPQWDVDEKWDTDLKLLLPYLDYFLPNENELELLLSGNNININDLKQFISNAIICTCGNKGSKYITKHNTEEFASYLNEKPVDCIGAGDAFTAAFLTALTENKNINDAIAMAGKNGALSTTVAGGQVPYVSRSDFEERLFKFTHNQ
ncbi:carbohydrate kinase family protein [Carboxylicivirga marina]|uniref:carbohydrate kinase family protein n=1 Tax=Carboxylicivirga marina TaxID=2800988 RepID=UPI0025946955|nr:carbohydrate kinase family protein [uncultured Carboxylicivirga sp.]